ILDLEPLEVNLFRGRSPQVGWQRVFGGQVIGQALVAACRTVEHVTTRPPHSLHAYFLLGGDPKVPLIYEVDRIRDATTFTSCPPPRGGNAARAYALRHGGSGPRRRGTRHAPPLVNAEGAVAGRAAARGGIARPDPGDGAGRGPALIRARAANRAAPGRVRAL